MLAWELMILRDGEGVPVRPKNAIRRTIIGSIHRTVLVYPPYPAIGKYPYKSSCSVRMIDYSVPKIL
jgi:hypothetical protein